jgi:hypothetical protein
MLLKMLRQYRTALNHLLQIKGAKKELCKVLKKNINQEVQKLCSNDSVFRSSNISKFSWKSAFKQLENDSPFIVDIHYNCSAGKFVVSLQQSISFTTFETNVYLKNNTFKIIINMSDTKISIYSRHFKYHCWK